MLERAFPSLVFYFHLVLIVWRAGMQAKKGRYSDRQWVESSFEVLNRLERAGIRMEISGVETLERLPGPVVFVANHMSMMETMILPVIIQPVTPITYVIKQSLLEYPVFKYVMRSRNPIAVSRSNPRQDLKTVLEEGVARLGDGVSVIVFPQTTRSHSFDRQQMSSIGVKLAKRAGVPVVPIALKTDCWNNGSLVKDCGRLDPSKTRRQVYSRTTVQVKDYRMANDDDPPAALRSDSHRVKSVEAPSHSLGKSTFVAVQ